MVSCKLWTVLMIWMYCATGDTGVNPGSGVREGDTVQTLAAPPVEQARVTELSPSMGRSRRRLSRPDPPVTQDRYWLLKSSCHSLYRPSSRLYVSYFSNVSLLIYFSPYISLLFVLRALLSLLVCIDNPYFFLLFSKISLLLSLLFSHYHLKVWLLHYCTSMILESFTLKFIVMCNRPYL